MTKFELLNNELERLHSSFENMLEVLVETHLAKEDQDLFVKLLDQNYESRHNVYVMVDNESCCQDLMDSVHECDDEEDEEEEETEEETTPPVE